MADPAPETRKGTRPTVFLERDGVLNQTMATPIDNPHQLLFLPGALRAAARLAKAGYRTVVVSEEPALATGGVTVAGLENVHRCLRGAARAAGGNLDEIFVCPHESGCDCHMPDVGLLKAAHAVVPVDWSQSYLVGASKAAIGAGRARSVRTILVGEQTAGDADFLAADLVEAVAIILGEHDAVFSRSR